MGGKTQQGDRSAQGKYYRLHTKAVDDLVNANADNTPQYSKEELEKYRSGRGKRHIPQLLKVLLIKAWFYGAVCFFVFWGLGLYVGSQLDLLVIAAVIMGLVTDLLINSLLRFGEKKTGESWRYIMVTRTGALGLLLNLLYAGLMLFAVVTAYMMINTALKILGGEHALFLGVGPIGFGLIATGADTLFISFKHLVLSAAAQAKRGV